MTIEYRGYTIEVMATQGNGLWAAEVWIWQRSPGALFEKGQVEGYVNQGEAEESGRRWGEIRIDFELRDNSYFQTTLLIIKNIIVKSLGN